jgi:membrane protease YdiL (CAAX protease family)
MSAVRKFVESHSIALFVFGAYLISWPIWFAARSVTAILHLALFGAIVDIPLTLPFRLLGDVGPGVSATIVLGITGGSREVSKLWRGLSTWPTRPIAYLIPLGLLPCFYSLIAVLFYSSMNGRVQPNGSLLRLIFLLAINLPFAPIWEEIGWRGFLLPRLESQRRPLRASLFLAGIWAPWHLPIYWDQSPAYKMWFAIYVTALAILLTWTYNASKPSLIPCVSTHLIANVGLMFLIPPMSPAGWMPIIRMQAALVAAAAIIIALLDPTLGQRLNLETRQEPKLD